MATGLRKAGDFCWINMLTPDPSGAMEFFGRVLGWTYFEMPGLGHGMRVGGRDIGGLFDLPGFRFTGSFTGSRLRIRARLASHLGRFKLDRRRRPASAAAGRTRSRAAGFVARHFISVEG